MSGNNLTGANIGSYGEVVHGDQIGRQYNISLTQVPGWLEAEKEIQQILKDVSDLRSCTILNKGLPKGTKYGKKGVIKVQMDSYGNHRKARPRASV